MKIIFIALMEELKIEDSPGIRIIYTGMGKLNSALTVVKALIQYSEADLKTVQFYNIGTCGSLGFPIGTIVNPMVAREGDHFYDTKRGISLVVGSLGHKLELVTSDNFVDLTKDSDIQIKPGQVRDMEAFAIAATLELWGKRLHVIKVVSDNLQGTIEDWRNRLESIKGELEQVYEYVKQK